MSRSGYIDDFHDGLEIGRWRGQVMSATRGKRGQKLLREMLGALDEMPEKALVVGELKTEHGEVCALGALAVARGMDVAALDADEPEEVAAAFDIAPCLAQEIVYMNDEHFDFRYVGNQRVGITPEERWAGMRKWVAAQITDESATKP